MSDQQELTQTALTAAQVQDYLKSHPEFFEQHAKLLAEITLPSPHGSGVISLAERQQLAQRDKIRVLESLMEQMIANAEENEATAAKVHEFSLQLLNQQSFSSLQKLIHTTLQTQFKVTQSRICIWVKPSNSAIVNDAVFTKVDDSFSDWVISLKQPQCGQPPEQANGLMPENLQSFAFIPLCKHMSDQHAFGVLILGSDDTERFQAGAGTHYLARIGELVGAALLNHLFALKL